MAVSAKTRAKRHANVKKTWEADMPAFKPLDYTVSLLKVLGHFSTNVDEKVKKSLAIDYWKKQGKDVTAISKLAEGWFLQAGPVAYLLDKGNALDDRDIKFLAKKYAELVDFAKQKEEREAACAAPVPVVKPNPQDAIKAKAALVGAEIDGMIDAVISGKVDTNPKEFLTQNGVSAPVAKQLQSFYKPLLKELDIATSDKDYEMSEAYSHLGKREMNRLHNLVREVVKACDTVAVLAKTTRKPRKRKEKPAGVLVAKVKYLKEFADLNMKSVHPEKMVGAEEVWVFNVKYRKLFQYVAQDGMQLSVKGTTLQNFDPEKSGAKTIRKPDEFFKGVDNMTKRPLTKAFKEIRGVLAKATGRINEECLIVKVF
jgi:hypothetical protein